MKYKIAITPKNIDILVEKFSAEKEKLTTEYWVKHIMSHPEIILGLVDSKYGSPDLQTHIRHYAGKLRKKYIRKITGIPKIHRTSKQRSRFLKFIQKHNLN